MTFNGTEPPLLSVANLNVAFVGRRETNVAVDGLSFDVRPGETVAVVGESGSGKSVTALSVLRLIEREGGMLRGGAIRFRHRHGGVSDLRDLSEPGMRAVRGNEISMIFQEPITSLNPVLSVGDQLAEVLIRHQGKSLDAALTSAEAMLRAVRLPEPAQRLKQYPHELSGGMRQRVMIAMALACRPSLLIADEPTTALDVTIQAQILRLIRTLQQEIGMAVLFITHDMAVVAEIADRVVVMRAGRKVEEGDVATLFATPQHPYTKALLAAVPRLGGTRSTQTSVTAANDNAAAEVAPVVAVEGLTARFPVRKGLLRRLVARVHAVENISFAIRPGETLGLVGESGCGKSTTGRAILKLIEPTQGRIEILGRDVTRLGRAAMRPIRRDVQMIFQDPYAALNPRLPAVELVTEPLAIHGDLDAAGRREVAAELLARVGLSADHLDRYAHQFSGGQRQRLCIARALSVRPKLIIADEPLSALDVSIQAQVVALLRELQADLGLAYLFISHDMAVVEQMSHRVAVMRLGQIVEHGPTETVLHDARHAYTRALLAAVPIPDPSVHRAEVPLDARDMPSPIHPVGETIPTPPLDEIAPGHFVQPAS